MAGALAALAGLLAGPAQSAHSGLHAAQEPPLVVPDSAPVAPDPAPIAPDPAPAPPDSASQTPSDSPASAAPTPSFEAQSTPVPVPATTARDATPGDSSAKRTRARARRARTRDAAGGRRAQSGSNVQPPSRTRPTAPISLVGGLESGGRGRELTGAGLALLALVLLSGVLLRHISPRVREREL
jgi:hypothetical protein